MFDGESSMVTVELFADLVDGVGAGDRDERKALSLTAQGLRKT